jgi:hypothetical protein
MPVAQTDRVGKALQESESFLARDALYSAMARTFVRVELEFSHAEVPFSAAMDGLGFVQTVEARISRKKLRLPSGMYLIERTSPVEALELTRQAARQANVRARIFCMPVGGAIRFGNLQADKPYAAEHSRGT